MYFTMGATQSSVQTTPTGQSNKQTAFDPRSPSNAIQRTPMRESAVPEDPRSPSEQIDRTPLHLEQENTKEKKKLGTVKKILDYDNMDNSKMPLASRNV